MLFNSGPDPDAIRVIADRLLARHDQTIHRARASLWRLTLLDFVLEKKLSVSRLTKMMRDIGCSRQPGTIRQWLENDEIIAPRSYDDVRAIARITGDSDLRSKLESCIKSIGIVRGTHIEAGRDIAKQILGDYTRHLARTDQDDNCGGFDMGNGLVVARIVEIDRDESVEVRRQVVNRLIEGGGIGTTDT